MTKKMRIFDFDNAEVWVDLKDKEIESLSVTVLSGDEVVTVRYEDGDMDVFDSSKERMEDFYDGFYEVPPEQLDQWMNFYEPCEKHETMSYKRQEAFSLGGKFCNMDDLAKACAKRIIAEATKEAEGG